MDTPSARSLPGEYRVDAPRHAINDDEHLLCRLPPVDVPTITHRSVLTEGGSVRPGVPNPFSCATTHAGHKV